MTALTEAFPLHPQHLNSYSIAMGLVTGDARHFMLLVQWKTNRDHFNDNSNLMIGRVVGMTRHAQLIYIRNFELIIGSMAGRTILVYDRIGCRNDSYVPAHNKDESCHDHRLSQLFEHHH